MATLTVSRDVEGNTGVLALPVNEIAYIEYANKIDRIVVHSVKEEFYTQGTLRYWLNAFNNSGYQFMAVDRTNVVNLDRIVLLDNLYQLAFFEEDVTPRSKRCTLTRIRFQEIQKQLGIVPGPVLA